MDQNDAIDTKSNCNSDQWNGYQNNAEVTNSNQVIEEENGVGREGKAQEEEEKNENQMRNAEEQGVVERNEVVNDFIEHLDNRGEDEDGKKDIDIDQGNDVEDEFDKADAEYKSNKETLNVQNKNSNCKGKEEEMGIKQNDEDEDDVRKEDNEEEVDKNDIGGEDGKDKDKDKEDEIREVDEICGGKEEEIMGVNDGIEIKNEDNMENENKNDEENGNNNENDNGNEIGMGMGVEEDKDREEDKDKERDREEDKEREEDKDREEDKERENDKEREEDNDREEDIENKCSNNPQSAQDKEEPNNYPPENNITEQEKTQQNEINHNDSIVVNTQIIDPNIPSAQHSQIQTQQQKQPSFDTPLTTTKTYPQHRTNYESYSKSHQKSNSKCNINALSFTSQFKEIPIKSKPTLRKNPETLYQEANNYILKQKTIRRLDTKKYDPYNEIGWLSHPNKTKKNKEETHDQTVQNDARKTTKSNVNPHLSNLNTDINLSACNQDEDENRNQSEKEIELREMWKYLNRYRVSKNKSTNAKQNYQQLTTNNSIAMPTKITMTKQESRERRLIASSQNPNNPYSIYWINQILEYRYSKKWAINGLWNGFPNVRIHRIDQNKKRRLHIAGHWAALNRKSGGEIDNRLPPIK